MAITIGFGESNFRPLAMPEKLLFAEFEGLVLNTGVWADWQSTPPFIDLMETARPFTVDQDTLTNAQFKELGLLDEQGWVKKMPDSGNPETYCGHWVHRSGKEERAGEYTMTWEGEGTLSISTAGDISGVSIDYANKIATFTLNASSAEQFIRFSITSVNEADHLRNIKLMKNSNIAAYNDGQRVNPDYKTFLSNFKVAALRNLNAHGINGSGQVNWEGRKLPGGPNRGRIGWEQWVTICNELEVPMWICVPHLATTDYITELATYVRDNFNPNLLVYWEWSNEVWNTKFGQAKWLRSICVSEWDPDGSKGYETIKYDVRHGYHAKMAVTTALTINAVFGEEGRSRIKHVVGSQLINVSLIKAVMSSSANNYWIVNEPEAFVDPKTVFDYLSPSHYYGTEVVQSSADRTAILDALETSEEAAFAVIKSLLLDQYIPAMLSYLIKWRTYSQGINIPMIPYEGGEHVIQAFGITIPEEQETALRAVLFAFFQSQHMVDCYEVWFTGLRAIGFAHVAKYVDVEHQTDRNAWSISSNATAESLLRTFFETIAPPDE
jgi:hypothetical protein